MLECAAILVIRYTVHFNIFKIPTIELTVSESAQARRGAPSVLQRACAPHPTPYLAALKVQHLLSSGNLNFYQK